MTIEANLITGLMCGFEYVHSSSIEDYDGDEIHFLVIDLLFIRFVVSFG
jgi:hypothetical protein